MLVSLSTCYSVVLMEADYHIIFNKLVHRTRHISDMTGVSNLPQWYTKYIDI